MGNTLLNELKYNINQIKMLDEGDAIIVFQGNVFPIYMSDTSKENISYLVNVIKYICNVFTDLYNIFFDENGNLKENLIIDEYYRFFDAIYNFVDRPKLLFGEVENYDGYYAVRFENISNYDIKNSNEFNALTKTDILHSFKYVIVNDEVFDTNELQNLTTNIDKDNIADVLYHGTCEKYIYDILTKGLRQIKENSTFKTENKGYVFLTSLFDIAKNSSSYGTKFAKIGYKGIVMPNAIEGVYIKTNGEYKFYNRNEYLDMQTKQQNNESINHLNEWKPSNFDTLANTIKLYHGTDIYALEDILYDGEISAINGKQHGETKGMNWFSTKISDNFNRGVLLSIEVPKSDFDKGLFHFMNDSEVTSEYGFNIPIEQYNIHLEKIGGWTEDTFQDVFKLRANEDIFEFVEIIARTNRVLQQIDCMIENPVVNMIIRQFIGDDVLRKEGFLENVQHINEVDTNDISLKSFETKDSLHPKFWVNDKLNSRVRLKLLDIADDFLDELSISWVKPKDIVLTGSIANYNWSKYSDIDVHIIINYKDVYHKKEFVEDYFGSKKELWSNNHDGLKIYGFPVEIYVEDENAKTYSNGVYSLNKNEWIKEPKDLQDVKINEDYVKEYSASLMTKIDEIEKQLNKEKDNHKITVLGKKIKNIFDKLKTLRKDGLKSKGEMSSGNVIWKLFRRMGYLDKIWDIIYNTYNKANSIKESENRKKLNINEDYYKNSMTDKLKWFDGEPNEPAEYGGRWIHVDPLNGWERIGVVKDNRNPNKIVYVFANPKAEQNMNKNSFNQWASRNLSLNKDENGADGYNYFFSIDTRYCTVELYPRYKDTYYDFVLSGGQNKSYRMNKHKELVSMLFKVGGEIILHHDSSYKITDGVVKRGKTNIWSNSNDWGIFFWASKDSGSDPSNGQRYTYYAIVDANKCYDIWNNPNDLESDEEVNKHYSYHLKELNGGIACQTAQQTPIWCIRDNSTGQFYDKDWNEINKPDIL